MLKYQVNDVYGPVVKRETVRWDAAGAAPLSQ